MPITVPVGFMIEFPILGQWLDLQVDWAYRLPEKVNRRDIGRGKVYELARYKTLFALLKAVHPMFNRSFNLKNFAGLLDVSYTVVRYWATEERVQDKIREYAKDFVDHFMDYVVQVLLDQERDESGDDQHLAMHFCNLIQEGARFEGLILEVLLGALGEPFQYGLDNRQRNIGLLQFVEALMGSLRITKPDITKKGVKEFYDLFYDVKKKNVELYCDYLEQELTANPGKAIQIARCVRADVLNILEPGYLHQREAMKKKPTEGQRRGGTLRDPVEEKFPKQKKYEKLKKKKNVEL